MKSLINRYWVTALIFSIVLIGVAVGAYYLGSTEQKPVSTTDSTQLTEKVTHGVEGGTVREDVLNFEITAPAGWRLTSRYVEHPTLKNNDSYQLSLDSNRTEFTGFIGYSVNADGQILGRDEGVMGIYVPSWSDVTFFSTEYSSLKVACEEWTKTVCYEKTNPHGVVYYETEPFLFFEDQKEPLVAYYIPLRAEEKGWKVLALSAFEADIVSTVDTDPLVKQVVDSFQYVD